MQTINNTYPAEQKWQSMMDMLIDLGVATSKEVILVGYINGFNESTMNDILYALTGYRDCEEYFRDYINGDLPF